MHITCHSAEKTIKWLESTVACQVLATSAKAKTATEHAQCSNFCVSMLSGGFHFCLRGKNLESWIQQIQVGSYPAATALCRTVVKDRQWPVSTCGCKTMEDLFIFNHTVPASHPYHCLLYCMTMYCSANCSKNALSSILNRVGLNSHGSRF